MKITIHKNLLVQALAQVKGATGRGTLPILSYVLLRVEKSELALTCSDLDLTVRVVVDVRMTAAGAVCVRAALLHSIVNALPKTDDDEVTLEQVQDKLRLTDHTAIYDLGILESDEFPPLVKVGGPTTSLEQMPFVQMLFSVAQAMSEDDSRYVLHGVNLARAGAVWTAVATDGRRLHRMIFGVEEKPVAKAVSKKPKAGKEIKADMDVILPAKTVKQLLRLLPVEDVQTLSIKVDQSAVEFNAGNVTVVSKLVEGNFPNWRQVVPADGSVIAVPRAGLAESAARVALIDEHCLITLGKGFSKITAASKDQVDTGQERLAILEAEPFTIKLQVAYLLAALNSIGDAKIELCHQDEVTPLVLKSKTLDWLAVIMPMRQA